MPEHMIAAHGTGRRGGGRARASQRRLPRGTALALDAAIWAIGVVAVVRLGVDGGGPGGLTAGTAALAAGLHAVICTIGATAVAGRRRFATIDEIPRLLLIDVLVAVALMAAPRLLGGRLIPVESVVVAGALALMVHLAARWAFRRLAERHRPRRRARRAVVLGAGFAGAQAIRMMLEDSDSAFQPVAVLDDDPATHHRSVRDVRVAGPWGALERVARTTRADAVVLASAADPESVDGVVRRARALGLEVQVMPSPAEVASTAPARRPGASPIRGARVLRPLEVTDLLERRAVETDAEEVAAYLTGERVLVTGAGGSIGFWLCREIARYEPDRLTMVDRDASALRRVQMSLDGEPALDSPDLVLGDLRAPGFIDALFEEVRPTVVFHAAGLSRLALADRFPNFPNEAFLTNVVTTRDLLLAAAAHNVNRFINVSTDRAAHPVGVLDCSERLAERLTSTLGKRLGGSRRFISVRFGAVLESHGPVLQTLVSQMERGLPTTITDPRLRRFFTSADQACQLVLQAGAMGLSGQALILDMGRPHDIEEVARRFAGLRDYPDTRVARTRMKPERAPEPVAGETGERTPHPLITQTTVPPVPMSALGVIDDLCAHTHRDLHGAVVGRWLELAAGSDGVTTAAPAQPPRTMPSAA